jgi:DtxR family Mn-dependent transcriptional regulator
MTHSPTEENYIKSIYHLQTENGEVTTNNLAAVMQTRPASVTDMLKKLRAKKIVHYQRYRGFTLTEAGTRTALSIVRKHRLWEYFLVKKLGFDWDKVHAVAEELEHVNSEELIARLDNYLGNPAFDPHGDPIPDHKGHVKKIRQIALPELDLKKTAVVSSVKKQSGEILDLLNHFGIALGTRLRVTRRFEYDGSIEIKIDKKNPFVISQQVAQHIFLSI